MSVVVRRVIGQKRDRFTIGGLYGQHRDFIVERSRGTNWFWRIHVGSNRQFAERIFFDPVGTPNQMTHGRVLWIFDARPTNLCRAELIRRQLNGTGNLWHKERWILGIGRRTKRRHYG